ncbi:4Fe-4S dicluster domain-containing protein, partial [Sulfurospirillum arcachonense]|uniref:4Fe-4S dicluster domain-containing protein n=1 Tax=Sulfurospirillum arcachonense TaxID=57666 RepID=UPI0004681500
MRKEYLFYDRLGIEYPLDESIEITDEIKDNEYLVSNEDIKNTEIYAPEINFYVKNTQDDISERILNVKKLYEIRASNYDLAQDLDFAQEVGNKVLIVSNEEQEELINDLKQSSLTCIVLHPNNIVDVNGHIGKLTVTIRKEEELLDLECDQIIWADAPEFAMKQSGVYDANILGLKKAVEKVKTNNGTYNYKNFIKYDSSICQYHERNEEICGKCAEVCPTVAILKDDANKHLEFSHIDCHGCGGCISVCPSGAVDYSQMPRVAFSEISSFYENKVSLIIPRKMELEALHVKLTKNVLPLAIEGEKFLHEAHLMNLLQTSGNPIIFYTDFISKGTGDVIRIINEIFQKKYNKQAIFTCKDVNELEKTLETIIPIPECQYGINEDGMRKREIFSARLAHLVGEDDLGVVKTGEHVHYGNITINEEACTLCLSCVGACNVRALTAHPEDNTLRFNPSICTNCTYCEVVCPEKDCLSVIRDEITLDPDYFKQNVMAQDELFECVECGSEFATVKAVQKIANVMKPVFGNDAIRIKTLYCCADCKPKVMLQAHRN